MDDVRKEKCVWREEQLLGKEREGAAKEPRGRGGGHDGNEKEEREAEWRRVDPRETRWSRVKS